MEKSKEIYLFHQGTYYHAYNLLGCHPDSEENGAWFRVWAPNAKSISVIGEFNGWNTEASQMKKIQGSGIWEVFVPNTKQYDNYKYRIITADGRELFKADPFAVHSETQGGTCSKVYEFGDFEWTDKKFYEEKAVENHYEKPMNIYEVNLGSWKRKDDGSFYTYKEIADELVPYMTEMGYSHLELMPLTEFPYDGSWGYQVTGYYSVTSRYGTPEDFKYLINKCHENRISVILDWVPAHFPKDEHGLVEWDGSYLYENQGWDRMEHKTWGTRRFDYGRPEVQSFLISSATFFIDKYHIDGIRIDAVSSMLYLDYDKSYGEWVANEYGENKNLESIAFLRKLNSVILTEYPNVITIAEESTAWPMVTKPAYIDGLGFNYKWNMGWMNDTLKYVELDPFFRKDNHSKLTFSMFYAFSENFILPVSHDEVVHGKKSLLNKMFGDYDQKFDLMRTFMMYMYGHPGKKLTFMGSEFAQFDEWNHNKGIDFMLLDFEKHKKMHNFTKALNNFYMTNSEMYEIDYSWEGFKWLVADDRNKNVVAFERRNKNGDVIIAICNFSPVRHENYRIGVDEGTYQEVLNSNNEYFGGNGAYYGEIESEHYRVGDYESSLSLNLEPNSAVYFKKQEFTYDLDSEFSIDAYDQKSSTGRTPTIEAKSIVSKIIEAKTAFAAEPMRDDFIYTAESTPENKEVKQFIKEYEEYEPEPVPVVAVTVNDVAEETVVEKIKRPKGRPRKPVDPTAPAKIKRPKGRPRKPIDPTAPVKEKRPKGRPRKPVDPNAPAKIKRPKGRPRKPIDPNAPAKIKRPKGRPRKNPIV